MDLKLKQIFNDLKHYLNQLIGSFKVFSSILRFKQFLRIKLLHANPENLITPQHDVCIVGPPRSANTFSTKIFRYWNPDALIAHHVHLPLQVIYAVQWEIPCVVLLRNPVDSLTSMLTANNFSIHTAIFKYTNFYNRIKKVKSQIIVLKFEDVINNPDIIVTQLNRKFGTSFASTPYTEQIRKEIFSDIKNNPGRTNELLIAIPNQNKDLLKKDIKQSVINHHHFHKALSVYEEWVQYANIDNKEGN